LGPHKQKITWNAKEIEKWDFVVARTTEYSLLASWVIFIIYTPPMDLRWIPTTFHALSLPENNFSHFVLIF